MLAAALWIWSVAVERVEEGDALVIHAAALRGESLSVVKQTETTDSAPDEVVWFTLGRFDETAWSERYEIPLTRLGLDCATKGAATFILTSRYRGQEAVEARATVAIERGQIRLSGDLITAGDDLPTVWSSCPGARVVGRRPCGTYLNELAQLDDGSVETEHEEDDGVGLFSIAGLPLAYALARLAERASRRA